MLTKSDLKEINNLFQTNIKPVIDEIKTVNAHNFRIEIKLIEMEEKLERNLKQWKSDLFNKIDKILGRVTTAEEENVILHAREEAREEIKDEFDKRISKLEKSVLPA